MKSFYLAIALFICSTALFASSYHGTPYDFKQPDGSLVTVLLYGDNYYMRAESVDGYTLIRDKKTNWICYAILSADKKSLESTNIKYIGLEKDQNTLPHIKKHVDLPLEVIQKIATKKEEK